MFIIKLIILIIFRETIVVYSDDQLKFFEQNYEALNIKPNVSHNVLKGYIVLWFLTSYVKMCSAVEKIKPQFWVKRI